MTSNQSIVTLLAFVAICASSINAATTSTKILAFGDFGTGTADQDTVAKAMISFCKKNGCDFGFTVGDNIYPGGIENINANGKADYDKGKPNFGIATEIFVNRYKALNMPIYMTYGNHDVGNASLNVFKDFFKNTEDINKRTLGLMDNQVAYTNHKDNPTVIDSLGRTSRLWMFPGPFYNVDEKGDVGLWSLDTNSFPHNPLDTHKQLNKKMPKNYEQQKWLADSLAKSKSTWKFVFGHQPIYSHGGHGWLNTGSIKEFRGDLEDALCKNKVDFYVAGHDHHLEVDVHHCKNGHKVIAVLTGAAAKQDRIYKRAFPLFGTDENFIWGNGRSYEGSKSDFSSDDEVLGFTYFDILDDKTAQFQMNIVQGSKELKNGCFEVAKGGTIKKITCTK